MPNVLEPNKLVVTFPIELFGFKLFQNEGSYNVWLTDYNQYSLVYSCRQLIPYVLKTEATWILGRGKTLDARIVQSLKNRLAASGVDVTKFETAEQNCPN